MLETPTAWTPGSTDSLVHDPCAGTRPAARWSNTRAAGPRPRASRGDRPADQGRRGAAGTGSARAAPAPTSSTIAVASSRTTSLRAEASPVIARRSRGCPPPTPLVHARHRQMQHRRRRAKSAAASSATHAAKPGRARSSPRFCEIRHAGHEVCRHERGQRAASPTRRASQPEHAAERNEHERLP